MNAKRVLFLVLTACLLMACSSDDSDKNGGVKPEPTPTPAPSGPNATITFSVSSDNGQGTATQPFTASPGKPLNATLSQTVTYTDAEGQKQTVEPKATIAATVKTDTIHAADFAALTKLTQPQPKTDTKAGNPKTTTRQQLFDIGGQEITFDLSHEIYSYTNGSSQEVELPYLELKSPKFGSATPNETSNTRAVQGFGSMPVVSVTAIRLTPIVSMTRGSIVNTTTAYDVTVSFTIDAVTHNTSANATQALSTDIHYMAVVESSIAIPNASTSLSYELIDRWGTSITQSPYGFTAKESLSLEWMTESRCTYIAAEDLTTQVITLNPRAAITVTAKADTIYTEDNKESLSVVSATEPTITTYEDQPKLTSATQTFTIGGQIVTVAWKYEDYGSVVVEDSTVAMPYLQVGAPEVVEVTVTETAQSRKAWSRLAGKTYTMQKGQTRADGDSDINNLQEGASYYEVTVRFRQQLKGMNTQEPLEESVEYVVKYIAIVGLKLISTTYEKDYQWLEPWCDLPWRYNYIVRRVRTYSTGEKETDEFVLPVGANAPAGGFSYANPLLSQVTYHDLNYDNLYNDDFRFELTTKTGVPDINSLKWEIDEDRDTWNERNFNQYHLLFTDIDFNLSSPIENWYRNAIERVRSVKLYNDESEYVRLDWVYINFGDYFLYLDGQIIDFPEYRMTYDYNIKVEDASYNGLPAKVFTNELNGKFLGKDIYAATVDTVYQIK